MKTKTSLLFALMLISFAPMLHAQDFWERIEIPDSVTASCIATNKQGHIFIGVGKSGESGGVYRSMDDGQSWECVYDNQNHGVLSIAINSTGHIYVGKNGFDPFIKSTDNGGNWEILDVPPIAAGNVVYIFCVGEDTVYVASRGSIGPRITYTFNNWQDWNVTHVTQNTQEYVSDLAFTSTGDLYVSLNCYFRDQGGLYRSPDYGRTWEYTGLLNHQVGAMAINSKDEVFTGDWYVMYDSLVSGMYAVFEGSNELELIREMDGFTDIWINDQDDIYVISNYYTFFFDENGQNFELLSGSFKPGPIEMVAANNGHVYGYSSEYIVKSRDKIITKIEKIEFVPGCPSIVISPNPAGNFITVNKDICNIIDESFALQVFDIEGKQLACFEHVHIAKPLDVSTLKAGLYFVRFQVRGTVYTGKFIKI